MKTDRLARRFLLKNPDGLTDAELLELLLRFTTDEAQTLAQRLLEIFPGVSALMDADTESLAAVEGLDEDSLLLLRLMPELNRRYFLSHAQGQTCLLEGADFGRYLLPYFYGARDELVYLLLLDAAGRVLNCRLIGHGSVNSANVPLRRMVQETLTANATGVVLAHNHPSRIALPSREDVELTFRLRDALAMIDVVLLDHIIVADDDYVSLRESGYFRRI